MSGTYKATGINLKSTPLGETDRLLTILTEECGLIRVVAPGARKHKSSLGGRSSLFVVNHLLIAKGKTLDKIIQAESIESYPGLSQDLGKLTAGQYLAELTLCQALSEQPQAELFYLLQEHLNRLEALPSLVTLACLTHATFHLLVLAGLTPQVQACCVTQNPIAPDFLDPNWQVGFSVAAGGTVHLAELGRLASEQRLSEPRSIKRLAVASSQGHYPDRRPSSPSKSPDLCTKLSASEVMILQRLSEPNLVQELMQTDATLFQAPRQQLWLSLERVLRHYAEYHFDRPIRSAALIDACLMSPAPSYLAKP